MPENQGLKNTKTENVRKNFVEYRHIYPEFLPDPKIEFRNKLREKLERNDMIARRTQIDIPEFYVGEFYNFFASLVNSVKIQVRY